MEGVHGEEALNRRLHLGHHLKLDVERQPRARTELVRAAAGCTDFPEVQRGQPAADATVRARILAGAPVPGTRWLALVGLTDLELLEQQVKDVHRGINEKAATDEQLKGMGATLTLAWFTPENLYIAHAGDSRLYLFREDETQQITEDHSFCWKKLKRGELTERQYRNNPKRSVLCEVIGGGHSKVSPSVAAIPYQKGDRFMLCSDGIIDGLWEKHIHSALGRNRDSTSAVADALMTRAIDNDGSDDTTLIVIDVR